MSFFEIGAEFVRKHPRVIRVGAAVILGANALAATPDVKASTNPKNITSTTQRTGAALDIFRLLDSGNKIPIQKNSNGNDNNDSDDPNSEASNKGNTKDRLDKENKEEKGKEAKEKKRQQEEREQQEKDSQRDSEERKITQCIADLKNDPEFKREEIVPRRVRVIGEKGVGVKELAAVIKSRGLEPFDDPMHHSIHRTILGALGKPNEEFRNACLLMVLDREKVERAEPYLQRESPVDRAIKECTEKKRKQYANSKYADDRLNVLFEEGVSLREALNILRNRGYEPVWPYNYPRRITIINVATDDILEEACTIEQSNPKIDLVEPDFINRVSRRRTIIEAGFRQLATVQSASRNLDSLSWERKIAA